MFNLLILVEIQGKWIKEALEFGFQTSSVLQVSGLKVVFDRSNPIGNRIDSLHVLCRVCSVPKYSPINMEEWYRIVMPSFLGNGGDGFVMLRDHRRNHKVGLLDIDALVEYVENMSPIGVTGVKGRIRFIN